MLKSVIEYKFAEKELNMKIVKIISSFLATIMLLSTILSAGIMTVHADEAKNTGDTVKYEFDSTTFNNDGIVDYTTKIYETAGEKLAEMELVTSNDNFDLYFNKTINMLGTTGNYQKSSTGEWALVNKKTGEVLYSNPYDVAMETITSDLKATLLSQVLISYNSLSDTRTEKVMCSYTEAYERNQITVMPTRYGARVEYIIGRVDTKKLVPRRISQERFESKIISFIDDAYVLRKMKAFYELQSLDLLETEEQKNALAAAIPYVNTAPVYTITSAVTDTELYRIEKWIKAYTEYTYEDLTADHNETGYSGVENASPNFRLALDYTLTDEGLDVTLASSGIRYDSINLSLNSIQILPYLGAGDATVSGYNFIPDGSGALVRFGKGYDASSSTISSKLYGNDYSFHSVSGENQEDWRVPVFGTVTKSENVEGKTVTTGYVGIITEGEASAEIICNPDGSKTKYRSVGARFTPRAQDTYTLDSMTVSGEGAATWTVKSDRKYTGNYTIKIAMLSGDDANYAGMAKTYRNYLVNEGILKEKTSDSSIPLYIESFGDTLSQETMLGVPVTKTKPLTTFEDAETMLGALLDQGIKNINLKYSGWVNGGLSEATAPSKLNIDSSIGGEKGFKNLVSYIKENNLGLFPDFNFAYVSNFGNFDNFSSKGDGARTLDDRVATLQKYDPVYQSWTDGYGVIVSPNRYLDLYNDLNEDYSEFEVGGISLASVGGLLSSDSNKDYMINRDDSVKRAKEFLEKAKTDNGELMISYGNSYTLGSADHILDVPLESSNRSNANESVPFLGMVLHGYVNFTGTALNTAGDYRTHMLRSIENGASPYFILSYQNTSLLKSTDYSEYYSILFDRWQEDVVATYKEMNDALAGVQTSLIDNHEILANKLVKVTYDNGTTFIINYSDKEVALDSYGYSGMSVGAVDFVVIK